LIEVAIDQMIVSNSAKQEIRYLVLRKAIAHRDASDRER
jgi:hypothetical protein